MEASNPHKTPLSKEKRGYKGKRKTILSLEDQYKCSNNLRAARRPLQENSVADGTSIELSAAQYLHHIEYRLVRTRQKTTNLNTTINLIMLGNESILAAQSPITSGRS